MAPHQSESPAGAGLIANQNQESGSIVAETRDDSKAIATLKAELALRGYAVHDSSSGGFLVSRWGWARHCLDLAELRRLLEQIGGAA